MRSHGKDSWDVDMKSEKFESLRSGCQQRLIDVGLTNEHCALVPNDDHMTLTFPYFTFALIEIHRLHSTNFEFLSSECQESLSYK